MIYEQMIQITQYKAFEKQLIDNISCGDSKNQEKVIGEYAHPVWC